MKQMSAMKSLMNQLIKKKMKENRCLTRFPCLTGNERLLTMMPLIPKLENDRTRGKVCKINLNELLINRIWHVFEIMSNKEVQKNKKSIW